MSVSKFRICLAAALLALWPQLLLHAAAAPRPNIIVILTDDMGFSDLGCYGGEIETLNLDALAANGLRFTQFYNTARCCPTRAALLTGLYPHQAGMGHMVGDKPRRDRPRYQGDQSPLRHHRRGGPARGLSHVHGRQVAPHAVRE